MPTESPVHSCVPSISVSTSLIIHHHKGLCECSPARRSRSGSEFCMIRIVHEAHYDHCEQARLEQNRVEPNEVQSEIEHCVTSELHHNDRWGFIMEQEPIRSFTLTSLESRTKERTDPKTYLSVLQYMFFFFI